MVLAHPQHAKLAAKMLYDTVDAMWRAAGDTSTDYNFYTKRATLSRYIAPLCWRSCQIIQPIWQRQKPFLTGDWPILPYIPKLTKPAKGMANMAGRMAMRFASTLMGRRRAR